MTRLAFYAILVATGLITVSGNIESFAELGSEINPDRFETSSGSRPTSDPSLGSSSPICGHCLHQAVEPSRSSHQHGGGRRRLAERVCRTSDADD